MVMDFTKHPVFVPSNELVLVSIQLKSRRLILCKTLQDQFTDLYSWIAREFWKKSEVKGVENICGGMPPFKPFRRELDDFREEIW